MDCYKTAQRILYGNDFYLLLAGGKYENRYADEARRWCAKCHTELRFAYAESECYIIGCEKCHTKTPYRQEAPPTRSTKWGRKT